MNTPKPFYWIKLLLLLGIALQINVGFADDKTASVPSTEKPSDTDAAPKKDDKAPVASAYFDLKSATVKNLNGDSKYLPSGDFPLIITSMPYAANSSLLNQLTKGYLVYLSYPVEASKKYKIYARYLNAITYQDAVKSRGLTGSGLYRTYFPFGIIREGKILSNSVQSATSNINLQFCEVGLACNPIPGQPDFNKIFPDSLIEARKAEEDKFTINNGSIPGGVFLGNINNATVHTSQVKGGRTREVTRLRLGDNLLQSFLFSASNAAIYKNIAIGSTYAAHSRNSVRSSMVAGRELSNFQGFFQPLNSNSGSAEFMSKVLFKDSNGSAKPILDIIIANQSNGSIFHLKYTLKNDGTLESPIIIRGNIYVVNDNNQIQTHYNDTDIHDYEKILLTGNNNKDLIFDATNLPKQYTISGKNNSMVIHGNPQLAGKKDIITFSPDSDTSAVSYFPSLYSAKADIYMTEKSVLRLLNNGSYETPEITIHIPDSPTAVKRSGSAATGYTIKTATQPDAPSKASLKIPSDPASSITYTINTKNENSGKAYRIYVDKGFRTGKLQFVFNDYSSRNLLELKEMDQTSKPRKKSISAH